MKLFLICLSIALYFTLTVTASDGEDCMKILDMVGKTCTVDNKTCPNGSPNSTCCSYLTEYFMSGCPDDLYEIANSTFGQCAYRPHYISNWFVDRCYKTNLVNSSCLDCHLTNRGVVVGEHCYRGDGGNQSSSAISCHACLNSSMNACVHCPVGYKVQPINMDCSGYCVPENMVNYNTSAAMYCYDSCQNTCNRGDDNNNTNSNNNTVTATSAPSASKVPTPSKTSTRDPSRTSTRAPSRSETRDPSRSETRNPSRSSTRAPSRTSTRDPSRSSTRSISLTRSAQPTNDPESPSQTRAPSRSETRDPSRTSTRNPSRSSTRAPSRSETRDPSRTSTRNPSRSSTRAPSRSSTRSRSRSISRSRSRSQTPTRTGPKP